jgi:autotransporter-associated beta strand protein
MLDMETFNTSEQIASIAGGGAVTVGPNSTLTVDGALDTVFSGTLRGGGGLTKGGLSSLTLSGVNDYLGATLLNGGTLQVNGSIGALTAAAGTTLAPQAGPGVLNVRGDFDLQSGATLRMELGGSQAGTGYDRINVTGGVTLAGELQGSLLNNFTPTGDIFFLIVNDGIDPTNGAFSNVAEGGRIMFGGTSMVLTYKANAEGNSFTDGNDVALLIPEPTSAAMLLAGMGSLLGLGRFRRRRD